MRKLFSLAVAVVMVVSAGKAKAEGYRIENPSITIFMSGDIDITKDQRITVALFHGWDGIGKANSTYLCSYVFLPIKVGAIEIAPGLGVVNSIPETGKFSGILSLMTYGKLWGGRIGHYSQIDFYVSPEKAVNVWATTRWSLAPIEKVPLNIEVQASIFNTSVTVAPGVSYSWDHVSLALQFPIGMSDIHPQIAIRLF